MAERLCKNLKKFHREKKIAETILISSKLVIMHANDLIDEKIIENGVFVPFYEVGSIASAMF